MFDSTSENEGGVIFYKLNLIFSNICNNIKAVGRRKFYSKQIYFYFKIFVVKLF